MAGIVICGAGTLGGNLAEHLGRTDQGWRLTVIDADTVEARNLSQQPYGRDDVGRLKVRALADHLHRVAGAVLDGVPKRLTAANAGRLLRAHDLIVDAFDNHASRLAVQSAARALGCPCLHAGLSNDGFGEVRWDENYEVPRDRTRDACASPSARGLALLVVVAAAHAIETWRRQHQRLDFAVTAGDLRVSPV